ncbi:hypothetical protein BDZ94DRAFT_1294609 [Collybia nuda]|uniref:Uncharacterized protein n=1 Tax=Collybia nuda TaxID=64659 RepID=A0A9P5YFX9_9AGAR|nr:hypothetical protein BDZ94DRAFT_1294609 [Collybia nuda]
MADPIAGQGIQRQGSLRSVASNTSIGSGVSLTRRARTRARSKTLTGGGSSVRSDKLPKSPTSELPYLEKVNVQQPLEATSFSTTDPLTVSTQPLHSPHRTETMVVQPGDDGHSPVVETYSGDLQSYSVSGSKVSRQTSGLQIHPTVFQPQPPPSAFSRDPSLTRINMAGANVRDSMSTQQSGVSSSIYPPSSSTTSESPSSPRSMAEQIDTYDVSSYDPDLGDVQEYDGDDVAYRLRLLVNNKYFLPPAHSKPSPSDFAPTGLVAPKKPARSTTPTFMDLFRGKAKSKPTTPTGTQGFDPNMPALRTAADSITASFVLRPQPRSSSQFPRHAPLPGDRSGRVVVVREKMHDIAVAAKQAEQDMKARGIRLDSVSQLGPSDSYHDVIDPTDAVDLPPPSSTYPFAVQASALHGLGVQDSVGAALLAERLPPPGSPGMSDAEDDWRKALLHQAVHHSLDSTSPDVSSFSMLDSSTPLHSPKPNHAGATSRATNTKRLLEQRILTNPILSDVSPPQRSRKRSTHSQSSLSRSKELSANRLSPLDTSRPSSYLPLRADTPIGPLTPLTPPPRKYLVNPLYSLSQTDLPRPDPPRQSLSVAHPPPPSLRKTMSSPMLSDSYESDTRHAMLTPPPLPRSSLSVQSSSHDLSGSGSFETSRSHPLSPDLVSSASRYSEDDLLYDEEDAPRASIALSAVNDGRPSFSEYSQPSPTASVFRDHLYQGSHRSITPSHLQHSRRSIEQESVRDSPVPRYSAMSPPPRISSSLAHFALSPPPRSSSFHYKAMTSRMSNTPPISEPDHSSSNQPLTDDTTLLIIAPEPTTPPFPIAERRGIPSRHHLSVDIPPTDIPVAIHSAPGPSSPTSFFDSIQTQPNAMDDLDSSSGESDDEDGCSQTPSPFIDTRTRAISQVPPVTIQRPTLMRFGNHSSPYVGRATENRRPSLGFGDDESRKPVGNIPLRAPFFTERSGKSDQGHGPPVSTYDFYKYTQQHRPASSGEPSTVTTVTGKRRSATIGPVAEWRNHQKAQESLRRLDGMLLQHMETEKDTIKRIATSVRSNIATQKSGHLYS